MASHLSATFTLRIRRSENLRCQGANGRFERYLTFKLLLKFWEIFETIFLPLLLIILSGHPRLLIIHDADNKLGATFSIISPVEAHVCNINVTHNFLMSHSFLLNIFRIYSGPNLSALVLVNNCISNNRSLVKGTFSGLKNFLGTDSPLKAIKSTTLKTFFVLKLFKFLSWPFGHVENSRD